MLAPGNPDAYSLITPLIHLAGFFYIMIVIVSSYLYIVNMKKCMLKINVSAIVLLLLFVLAHAQDENRNSLVALPYAYFTPETDIAAGVGSVYSFRAADSKPDIRPSNIKVALTFTQRKQLLFAIQPELYFNNEAWLVNGTYNYYKYPDKYWGAGINTPDENEEDFTPSLIRTFTNIQKRILPGLYTGIRYQFEYIALKETDPNGVLQYKTIPGSGDGAASGLGILVNWDTRNHTYFPTSGHYHQFYAVSFGSAIGSDFDFTMYTLDLRHYMPIFKSHVLAFHSYNIFIDGNPPFQMMGLLGGSYWMRGYYFGRYRDNNMITMQTEYRYPLFWRFGGVFFAGLGDVACKIDHFHLRDFKVSYGAGIRFMFDTREKINARLDLGFDEWGTMSIYALVVEAF